MAWAKLHTDMLGDVKLVRGARAGLRGLEFLPWLILFAKQANDNGRLSVGPHAVSAEDLAPLIPGATVKAVRSCLASSQAIGVLAVDPDGVLRFERWHERQGKPSDTRERVRDRVTRHRERRDVTPRGGVTATPHTRVTVTRTEETEEKRQKRGDLLTNYQESVSPNSSHPPGFVEPTPEEREDLERRKAAAKAQLLAARDARLAAEANPSTTGASA